MNVRWLWLLTMLAPVLFTGCIGEEGAAKTNDLRVFWVISPGTCADANVLNVRVDVKDGDGVVYDSNLFLCSNGQGLLPQIPEGDWTVELVGLDDDNRELYDGPAQEVKVEESLEPVEVKPPVQLSVRRAVIDLAWSFSSGKPCNFTGVHRMDIVVWDQVKLAAQAEHNVDCDIDPTQQDDLHDGSRPLGYIIGDLVPRAVKVEIRGLDESGVPTHVGATDIFDLEPAGIHRVDVTLSPCGGRANLGCQ